MWEGTGQESSLGQIIEGLAFEGYPIESSQEGKSFALV